MELDKLWAQADRALAQLQRGITRELLAEYRKTLREVRALLGEWHERYGGDALSYAEMQKYNRLAALERALAELVGDHSDRVGRLVRRGLEETYQESHRRTGWILGLLLGIGYAILRREDIRAAVQSVISGLTLNQRLTRMRQDLAWRVREAVMRGMVRGDSYGKMARDLRELLAVDMVRANRLVRTEAHRLQNEARFDEGKRAVKKGADLLKMWQSVLIPTTRDTHREMHGQVREPDEEFDSPAGGKTMYPGGFGDPAEDYNCLCYLTWISRDGKTIIDADVSFDEWSRRL